MRWRPKHAVHENGSEYTVTHWHKWFAWYPVPLGDTSEIAWLERVWRRVGGSTMNGQNYEYEMYLGEKRQLDPERLCPCLDESLFRAKQLGHPVLHRAKELGVLTWVHPNGRQEDADLSKITQVMAPYFQRTPTTMGEAVCFKPEDANGQSNPA
jgi:hypothetical protein